MPGFEFHPFLESHEIPNKKTSPKEDSLKVFQPFDKRNQAAPFNASGIAEYEILSSNEEEAEIKKEPQEIPTARPFDTNGKISLADHIGLKENERLHKEAESKDKIEKIKRLFKSGNIQRIEEYLTDDKVIDYEFAKEIEETKNHCASKIADATFLNQKHWKLLTGIRIFDLETFEHSIETFTILKNALSEIPELENEILNEGVTIEQFLWSGLSHDSGKMAIPDFILKNKTTDHEWAIGLAMLDEKEKDEIFIKIFDEKGFTITDEERHDPNRLAQILEEKRIRAVELVPIKTILDNDKIQIMADLGLDIELPLKKIMEIHEKKSEEILKNMGFVVEAMLAGNHHNYHYLDKKLGEKPVSLSTLHIGIEISSTIIHLADVQHAMNNDRSYHHKQPKLRILAFLIDDANKGKINPRITAIWIKNELSKMSPAYLEEIRNMSAKHQDQNYQRLRKEELELAEDFIEDNMTEENHSPFPKSNAEIQYADDYYEQHRLAA